MIFVIFFTHIIATAKQTDYSLCANQVPRVTKIYFAILNINITD